MSKRVLVVSSAYMNIDLSIDRVPEADETLTVGGGVAYSPGGCGANSAVTLCNMGAETVFCARVGRDPHGETLYDYYKDMGIDVGHLAIDRENPTGCAVIMTDEGGAKRTLRYPGANCLLSERDVDEAFLSCPDALFLQLDVGDAPILYAADYAFRHEIPIFMDGGPARAGFPLEKLPPMKVFSANEEEIFAYTGILPQGADSCLAATMELLHRIKTEYVVIKLGDRGAFVCNGRRYKFLSAYSVKVADAAAAGDAFSAALTFRLLENGEDITEAVRYANAVGALTVSRKGAAYSIPTAETVGSFLARHRAE